MPTPPVTAAACTTPWALTLTIALTLLTSWSCTQAGEAPAGSVPVKITGGHVITQRDFGRPVTLIAAGLRVEPEVFREAFSGVTPARGRHPTGAEARRNKEALMKVLAPHGVTNERLDEVSNYYRFRPESDEIWPTRPAQAYAVVEQGQLTRIVVTDPGSGYCSEPRVTIAGFPKAAFQVTLTLGKDLPRNGGVASIKLVVKKSEEKAERDQVEEKPSSLQPARDEQSMAHGEK